MSDSTLRFFLRVIGEDVAARFGSSAFGEDGLFGDGCDLLGFVFDYNGTAASWLAAYGSDRGR